MNEEEHTAVRRLDEALDGLMTTPMGDLTRAWQRVREAQQDVKDYLRIPPAPLAAPVCVPEWLTGEVYQDIQDVTYVLETYDPEDGEWSSPGCGYTAENLPDALALMDHRSTFRRRIIRCIDVHRGSFIVIEERQAQPDAGE